VEYVVVGGLAVILHGHARLTTDLDAAKAVSALTGLSFKPRAPVNPLDFANPEKRASSIREKNMRVFSFYTDQDPLFDVDLFVEHPRNFEDLFRSSVVKDLNKTNIRVCGLDHLIHMKEESGRPKDLEDARVLKLIKNG
jgi:hypothetical protein